MVLSCSVLGCKTDEIHKVPSLTLHVFPRDEQMRQKWCAKLGRVNYKVTPSSRICSLHFTDDCFVGKALKSNALPNRSFQDWQNAVVEFNARHKRDLKTSVGVEILTDINKELSKLEKPAHFRHPLGDDKNNLIITDNASDTVVLWGVINKQVNLINKLMSSEPKPGASHQKELEEMKEKQKEMSRKLETYKYVTKCLQEKQTTLEEQIEILSAVESR